MVDVACFSIAAGFVPRTRESVNQAQSKPECAGNRLEVCNITELFGEI